MEEVYGENLDKFLDSIKKPNSRFYLRVNTLKSNVDDILKKFPEFKKDEDFPEAIYTEVKGPYELEEFDTKVIVDKRTAESVMMGANAYFPGIKRILGNGSKVSIISENGILVGNGILIRDSDTIMVNTTESLYYTPKIADREEIKNGYIYAQGKASMFVSRVVDPQPGEFIIDMTASPGGKLTHVYQLEPRIKLIGFDHTYTKVKKTKELLNRLSVKAEVYMHDSRYLSELGIKDVDKVIIDPPCSALGLRPKLYDKKDKNYLINLQKYQKQFLTSAYQILKKGGEVIYSTCTVTKLENEEVINDPRFEIEYFIRFHPFIHDMTGFFIAKLKKK
ncbi:RsmB/NOP family class I SAM-dependent RNA methyltransferase [Acidianus manzaensis]|uniref:tRNA (cytosine(72)-C(5))-methyltransferase n=1 Tax=Acidianus manzaensis TaxID=282676 RepID=A0A1W6K1S8_9CREN|nr:RsmB/NOP family class I SAM-dependent RNA methyltransferase [Acidianus manzaensis]ARM76455.1 SAM-dependent methyltransferase [Acidianus manzaensis]